MKNKQNQLRNGILAFVLLLFSLVLAANTYAAQDFIIENRTSALFVVNGTTGNIFMAPLFGNVGIGTTTPYNTLTVVGSISGNSINATSINATERLIINNTLFVNGSRVGIGTAEPSQLFQVGPTTPTEANPYVLINGLRISGGDTSNTIYNGANNIGITAETGKDIFLSLASTQATGLTVKTASGNVGIGTTSPQNKLEVIGAATFAGGVNASSLNVTGFSIADDSLVTLSDGTKKKIKDIEAGEYVQTLDEKTGRIVPMKVNALLDHGIKPIYEMATEDGRAINTTAEHPYFVKSGSLPNKIFKAEEGVITLSGNAFFNPLSPENIGQLKARDKAIYGASLSCGADCLASGRNCRNSPAGIKVISSIRNSYASSNSCSDNLVNLSAFDLCFLTSSSKNSGAINSNLFNMAFNENTEDGTPLTIREEITTFASATNFSGIIYPLLLESSLSYLLANDSLTSFASSSACPSVNFDLETIFLNLTTFKSLSFNTLFISIDNSSLGIALNSDSSSSGILIINSAILTSPKNNNQNDYLKLSNMPLGEWIEVRYLKVGDEIAVPDYENCEKENKEKRGSQNWQTAAETAASPRGVGVRTSTSEIPLLSAQKSDSSNKYKGCGIKWEKISSIKTLEPQHVYDLSIEGTRNFIANDIVAHNTYLATSSGNVGIGATVPNTTLFVQGNTTIVGNLNVTGTAYIGTLNVSGVVFTGGNIDAKNITADNIDLRENKSLYQSVYPTDDGLVLYLPFSENANNISNRTYDRSPYGNDGTLTNMNAGGAGSINNGSAWTDGKYGYAMEFDGREDYVNMSNPSSITKFGNGSFAIEAWIKTSRTGVMSIAGAFEGGGADNGYRLNTRETGSELWFQIGTGGSGDNAQCTTCTYSDNNWHYLVGVKDGINVNLYYDGVLKATTTTPKNINTTKDFLVGYTYTEFFNGTIDEVRIYKRALAPEEIRTHYLRGSGFGAMGAITADKFRVINTSASRIFEVNQTGATIAPGGVQRLTIDSSGNVGIGNITPVTKLHVSKANTWDDELGVLVLTPDTSSTRRLALGYDTTLNRGYIQSVETGNSMTSLLLNAKGGNVGIGTTNPAYRLEVTDTGTTTAVNLSDVLFVDASSNRVGIGTKGPESIFHINGSGATQMILAADTGGVFFEMRNVASGDVGIDITDGSYSTDYTTRILHQSSTDSLRFYMNGSSSEAMILDAQGKIGINDSTPTETLDVTGTLSVKSGQSGNAQGLFQNAAGSVGIGTTAPYNTLTVVGSVGVSGSLNASSINTTGSAYFATSSGSVGIGTTTPIAPLHVDAGSATSGAPLVLENNAASGGDTISLNFSITGGVPIGRFQYALIDGSPNRQMYIDVADGSNVLQRVMTLGGSSPKGVGIGTTPKTTFHVNGTTTLIGNVTINDSTRQNSIFIDSEANAILFQGENGSLYQPVYGSDDGLVLYLPFNSPNGTTQYDRSPYGNDGTQTNGPNCNATLGKYGAACRFDKSLNQTINLTDRTSLSFTDSIFTFEFWFKYEGSGAGAGGFVLSKAAGGGQYEYAVSAQSANGGQILLQTWTSGGAAGPYTEFNAGNAPHSADGWHHAVVTADGNNATAYLDGILKWTVGNLGTSMSDTNEDFLIGVGGSPRDNYFNGTIDELKVYKRALTAEEVRTQYLRGSSFGAMGAITADKFRVVNTSGNVQLRLNQSTFSVTNVSGNEGLLYVDKVNNAVGIRTTSPQSALEIWGTGAENTNPLTIRNSAASEDEILLVEVQNGAGRLILRDGTNSNNVDIRADTSETIFNDLGGAQNFRIESDTNEFMFKVDGTNNRIGIAGDSPAMTLDVRGNVTIKDNLTVDTDTLFVDSVNNRVGIGTIGPQNKLEVIGAATFAGGVNASSLNVTGFSITDDSLVTLSDGTKKKIKDIEAGEEVLTLDEKSGKLVPRKVNALLDHGIKPIYEMATEDGRAINTTAEHPYLVKLYDKELCDKYAGNVWNKKPDEFNEYCTRWVEVKNLEITYSTISNHPSQTINNLPLNSLTSAKREDNADVNFSTVGGWIKNTTIPQNFFGGNRALLRKSESLESKTNEFSFASEANLPFLVPLAAYSAESPLDSRNSLISILMFSSSRNFGESDITFSADGLGSILQGVPDHFLGEARVTLNNTFYAFPGSNQFNNITDQNSSAFESWLPMADFSVRNNVFADFDSHSASNDNSVFKFFEIAVPDYSTGAIKWEKIVSIKTLEPQHVYDLNIEGTRNFIANDIVAHNTYLATSSGNVGIGATNPAHKLTVAGSVNISGNITTGGSLYLAENQSLYQPVYGSDDDLVLYLPFNAPNGTTQYDRSPYGNDGIQSDTTNCNATLGKYGAACEFDGIDDFINMTDSASLDLERTDAFTLEAWIKTKPNPNNNVMAVISKSSTTGTDKGYMLNVEGHNLRMRLVGSETLLTRVYSDTIIDDEQWHHIVGVNLGKKGGNASDIRLYVDGRAETLITQNDNLGETTILNDFKLTLGNLDPNQMPYNGTIDEVRIYKRALAPEEIRTHYLRGSGFGAMGAITADRFRVINTSASRIFEVNQTGATIAPGGVQRLTIDSIGRVGINTSSPGAVLDVRGSAVFNEDGTDADFRIEGDANSNMLVIDAGTDSAAIGAAVSSGALLTIGSSATAFTGAPASNLYLGQETHTNTEGSYAAGLNVVTTLIDTGAINYNAYGIRVAPIVYASNAGTTVNISSIRVLNFNPGCTGTCNDQFGLYIESLTSAVSDYGIYVRNADNYSLWVDAGKSRLDGDTYLAVDSGNVGIGTTTPNYLLQVASGTDGRSVNLSNVLYVNGSSGNVGIGNITPVTKLHVSKANTWDDELGVLVLTPDTSSTRRLALGYDTTLNRGYIQSVETGNSMTSLLLNAKGGNVGIGTTSPNAKLEVNETTAGVGPEIIAHDPSSSSGIEVRSGSPTGNSYIDFVNGSTSNSGTGTPDFNGRIHYTGSSGNLDFYTRGATRLTIDGSGNVGIGTTAPNYLLQVASGTDGRSVNLSNVLYVNGTNGSVGIGTANPWLGHLQIRNTAESERQLVLQADGGTNNNAWYLRTRYPGGSYHDLMLGLIDSTGADLGSQVYFSASPSSSVGIGTTSPNYLLQVASGTDGRSVNLSNVLYVNGSSGNVGIGTTTPDTKLKVSGDTNVTGTVWALGTNLSALGSSAAGWTDDGTTVRLTTATDNVGIGATNPAHKLTVAGNVNISGNLTTGGSLYLAENQSLYQPVYPSDDGLVLYLPFNAPNGTTQYDRSPYGNDGVLQGGINCNISLGKYGGACQFNNDTLDEIFVATSNSLQLGGNATVTVEAWVKPSQQANTQLKAIVTKGDGSQGEYNLMWDQTNDQKFIFGWDNIIAATSANTYNDNEWHHVVGVREGTADSWTGKIYVNGKLDGTGTTATNPNGFTTDVVIGGFDGVDTNAFNGTIDEVRIYKRALAAEEIRTHYLRGSGFGASGAITADKFRVVNSSGTRVFEINQTGVTVVPTNSTTAFRVNARDGTNVLDVDTVNARVGIGTTSPGVKLQVVGDIEARGGAGATSVSANSDDNAINLALKGDSISATGNPGIRWSGGTTDLIFEFSSSEWMRITDTGKVGIGTTVPAHKLTVAGSVNISGDISVGGGPHPTANDAIYSIRMTNARYIEWLVAGGAEASQGAYVGVNAANAFIWYDSDDQQAEIGKDIQALNDDGWATGVVDYGEYMEKLNHSEDIEVFEVVAVKNSKITKNTEGSSMIMVTSTDSGIRGGNPLIQGYSRENDPDWLAVAFIGQVPILVDGPVAEGDYIIPSGNNDGRAIAVPPGKISSIQFSQVIGRALESSDNPSYNTYNSTFDPDNKEDDSKIKLELGRLQRRRNKTNIINVAVGVHNGLPQGIVLDAFGNVNVSGRLNYGTLAANSPHFLETVGAPEPLCIKSAIGKYVGCMVDENFEFTCKIDDRCSRKYLESRLGEEVEKLKKEIGGKSPDENSSNAGSGTANESAASLITGNMINEVSLNSDLSSILGEESSATTQTTTEQATSVIAENSANETVTQNNNSTNKTTTDEKMTMTDTTYMYTNQTATVSAGSTEYKKLKMEKLSKIRDDVKKKSITVKQAKEQLKYEQLEYVDVDEIESEEDAVYTSQPTKGKEKQQIIQAAQLDYMQKVNGSVIIRLG